jgi:hypothetical protein
LPPGVSIAAILLESAVTLWLVIVIDIR